MSGLTIKDLERLSALRSRKLGQVTASSAGFQLPNADQDVHALDWRHQDGDSDSEALASLRASALLR